MPKPKHARLVCWGGCGRLRSALRLAVTTKKTKPLRLLFFISRNQVQQVTVDQGAEFFRTVAVGEHEVTGKDARRVRC
jgi:hypothetical protein